MTITKKIISTLCNILAITILIAIILFAGSLVLLQALGYQPMVILSGSMQPKYLVGGLIFIDYNAEPEKMHVGDVIAFRAGEDVNITHRIVDIDLENRTFTTKGDNNGSADQTPVSFDDMLGESWLYFPELGTLAQKMISTTGIAVGILILAGLIVLFVIPVLLAPSKDQQEKQKEKRKTAGKRLAKRVGDKQNKHDAGVEEVTEIDGETSDDVTGEVFSILHKTRDTKVSDTDDDAVTEKESTAEDADGLKDTISHDTDTEATKSAISVETVEIHTESEQTVNTEKKQTIDAEKELTVNIEKEKTLNAEKEQEKQPGKNVKHENADIDSVNIERMADAIETMQGNMSKLADSLEIIAKSIVKDTEQ